MHNLIPFIFQRDSRHWNLCNSCRLVLLNKSVLQVTKTRAYFPVLLLKLKLL